jgi:hypothetical protein
MVVIVLPAQVVNVGGRDGICGDPLDGLALARAEGADIEAVWRAAENG